MKKKHFLSKSELNHIFGKSKKLEEGTFFLHQNFNVNPNSSRKLQPLKTGPYKNISIFEVNYELMSPEERNLFAHRNH